MLIYYWNRLITKFSVKVEQLGTCSKHKMIELNLSESIKGGNDSILRMDEQVQRLLEKPLIDVEVILSSIIKSSRLRFHREFEKICQLTTELSQSTLEKTPKPLELRPNVINHKEKLVVAMETPKQLHSTLKVNTIKGNTQPNINIELPGSPTESLLEKFRRLKSSAEGDTGNMGPTIGEKNSLLIRKESGNYRLSGKKLENISTGVVLMPELSSRLQTESSKSQTGPSKENKIIGAFTDRIPNNRQDICEDKMTTSTELNLASSISRICATPVQLRCLKRESAISESKSLTKSVVAPQLKEGDSNPSTETNKSISASSTNLFKVHVVRNSSMPEEKPSNPNPVGTGKIFSSDLWKIYDLLAIDGLPLVIAHRPDHKQAQMHKVYNEMLASNADVKRCREKYFNQHKAYTKRCKSQQYGRIPPVQTTFSSSRSQTNPSSKSRSGKMKSPTLPSKMIYLNTLSSSNSSLHNELQGIESTRNLQNQFKISSPNKRLVTATESKGIILSGGCMKRNLVRSEINLIFEKPYTESDVERKSSLMEFQRMRQLQKPFEQPSIDSESMLVGVVAE